MKFGLLVSQENVRLVQIEIETILEQRVEWLFDSLGYIETSNEKIDLLVKSSAVLKTVIINPLVLNYDDLFLDKPVGDFNPCLNWINCKDDVEYRVTHTHLGSHKDKSKGDQIEKNIGSWIWQVKPELKVNLKEPTDKFLIFSTPNVSLMGWNYAELQYSKIASRAPKFGPYFQGGNMKPRLSRLIVNLLQPFPATILDPFAGHGGILREAADQNVFCIGLEISKKVMREGLANNRHFGYQDNISVIHADALYPPFRLGSFSKIVTDPPYAIQTTTKGLGSELLITKWLELQTYGVTIVFTIPDTVLTNLPLSWEVDIDELDYVHGGLTRRIRRITKVLK